MSQPASEQPGALAGKYLTFYLGAEAYGLPILKVHEIIGVLPITRIPRLPASVCGVINLRGKVIPVVDLRLKFGLAPCEATERTCIIVVEIAGVQMGVLVDCVSEVLDIDAGEIEPPPQFGLSVDTRFILGIGKAQGKVTVLLDITKALSEEEVVGIQSAPFGAEA